MKKNGPITQQNFRDNRGERCPNCRRFRPHMVAVDDKLNTQVGYGAAMSKVKCLACGATWIVIFRPWGYVALKPEAPAGTEFRPSTKERT